MDTWGILWERKSPEGTFLLDSHSAIWWKPGVFVSLRSECFSTGVFDAGFWARRRVRRLGTGDPEETLLRR